MDEREEATELRLNKEYLVIQANNLVRSKQDDLSLLEAKIIRLAIAQIIKNDDKINAYSCGIVELANFLGLARQNIYRDIQDISKSLIKKSIFIKEDKPNRKGEYNYKIFHWVDYIEYKDGIITFKISDSLTPYLIGLEELFTAYSYDAVIDLPTNYAIRLYELLVSWVNSPIRSKIKDNYTKEQIADNEYIFTIDYLREYFNAKDKYPNTGDFIKYIIDNSIKAINEKTFMTVSYRQIKQGRKIAYVVFKLNDYKDEKHLAQRDKQIQRIKEEYYKERGLTGGK